MKEGARPANQTRRQFLKGTAIAGTAFCLFPLKIFSSVLTEGPQSPVSFEYKFRTVSADHVREVGEWMEKLKKDRKLSTNETYRSYIGSFVFEPEKILQGAKSIVIAAIPQFIVSIIFHLKGKAYEIKTPSGYFSDGINGEDLKARIMKDIINDPAKKIQGGVRLPLKTFAVRSGLAEYGKNNITFSGSYGSFYRLAGFYTDTVLKDNWRPLKTMQLCKGCSICTKNCPTKCIPEDDNFVINAGRCIPLYNEVPGNMPDWMDSKAHNALIGCLSCQDTCPANSDAVKRIKRLAEINEKETELILNSGKDKAVEKSVLKKLELSSPEELTVISRNLKLVLANLISAKA